MKNVILNTKLFLMVLSAVMVMSCSAEDGEDGVMGPQGVAGTDGTNGTDGVDGADGQDGNANVIASPWFEAGSWTDSGSTLPYFDQDAPEVTEEIIKTGVVMAYTKLIGDGDFVRPLPAFVQSSSSSWEFFITESGTLRFTARDVNGGNFAPSSANEFRYVVIPASETAKKLPIDLYDYEAVKKYFNLKD